MRKIIQIAFEPYVNSETAYESSDLVEVHGGSNEYVLCDDGTVWFWKRNGWVRDERYDQIPQD